MTVMFFFYYFSVLNEEQKEMLQMLVDPTAKFFEVLFEHCPEITYRKVPKFSDARKLCCNLPKIQTKKPNIKVFCQKDANGIANSVDLDQTASLGAV